MRTSVRDGCIACHDATACAEARREFAAVGYRTPVGIADVPRLSDLGETDLISITLLTSSVGTSASENRHRYRREMFAF